MLSEPPCPAPAHAEPAPSDVAPAAVGSLHADRRNVRDIPRDTWDRLAGQNPWATPFSGWAFQRAWWDAYGDNAHDETLVVCADGPAGVEPIAIVPLMHRHEVEPGDTLTRTTMRHEAGAELTPVEPTATAVFFGASYHADYATILGAPADLPAIAAALVDHLADTARSAAAGTPSTCAVSAAATRRPTRWPPPSARARSPRAGRSTSSARTSARSSTCRPAPTMDDYLATLGKKERHEIRRKVRRAEAAGEVRLEDSLDPLADLDAFIDLHQKRWGVDGLFPETPGGAQSRVFFRRLFELGGPDGPLLTFLTVGGRRIAAGVHFETAGRLPLLQRRCRSRRARPVAGRGDDLRATSSGRSPPASVGSTSCAATSRTSTSGAPRTSRSSASSFAGGTAEPRDERARPLGSLPRGRSIVRRLAAGRRIRVVEVLATGTNGGAQEHLYSLVTRIDTARYDVSVVALSAGSAVRKLLKAGIPVLVIDDPDDAIAVGALAAHLAEVRADVVHAHMYRAETVATRAVIALGEAGQRKPYVVATIHSEPDPLGRGPAAPARADAVHGPPDRRLEGDRAQAVRRAAHHRPGEPRSTTASTSSATTTRRRAARCPRSTGWSPGRRSSAWSPGWSRRRATRRCSRRGRRCSAPAPTPTC